ncbi:MAG: right-handed parallel beta-helix repeat-containing protein [Rikenellaceae bacterium]
MKRTILTSLLLTSSIALSAANYYVAPNGKDSNKGAIDSPFATVGRALKGVQPGDAIYLREGRYHEEVKLGMVKGTAAQPIRIEAYQGEEVCFDGTQPIKAKWTKYKGNIYQTKLDFPIWQLFVDGKSMTSARYPNGNWYDGSIWADESMIIPSEKSVKNHFYGDYLKDFNFSLADGGVIIVNSSSWGTSQSMITSHTAGGDNFEFDPSTVKYRSHKPDIAHMRYYLEGKLELLDCEGEWFFDPKSKMLYLWAEGGVDPSTLSVSGKVQSYAFRGNGCSFVQLRGIDLFGTTFAFATSSNIAIEDCNLMFPTYSKRMLGNIEDFDVTEMTPPGKKAVEQGDSGDANFSVINCRFEYMDGPAIVISGKNILFENCLFAVIDYSCVYGDAAALYLNGTENLTFRHNTLHTSGASATLQLTGRSLIEYNDLSKTGYLQNDGSLVQLRVSAADGSIVRHNWLHNSVKTAIRTDNVNKPGYPYGVNATAYRNVSWQTDRGTFFKGDKHFVFNNVCFDNIQRDLIISSNEQINGINHSTITRNNLTNTFSGHQSAPYEKYPVPGTADHNWVGLDKDADIRSQLRDPDNLDFRPRKGAEIIDAGVVIEGKNIDFLGSAPDVGAYEWGAKEYWIPGFRDVVATVPVPCNATKTAKVDADLMWLGAYKATEYKVYFGSSADKLKLISTQSGNICTPPQLTSGKSYYWRVDCKGERGESQGEVWSFTVE